METITAAEIERTIKVGNELDGYYSVILGRNLTRAIIDAVPTGSDRVLVVYPGCLTAAADRLISALQAAGKAVAGFVHPDGEAAKDINVVNQIWQHCGDFQLSRTDTIIGFGGGATTDMAGFVAATWLRGINLINCPSTLLGMVDAAIGGKTGINTAVGKNLVGSFYPPQAVICDYTMLRSLPAADLRAGLGEVVKTGYISDPEILRLIRADHGASALDPDSDTIAELVARSVAVKAAVVSNDLKEGGQREILNYGHTLAHAIERGENYQWRHGEAVAVGMVYAAELAAVLGIGPVDLPTQMRQDLELLGLPTEYHGISWAKAAEIMASDKKVRHSQLRFVLLEEIAKPVVKTLTDLELLGSVYNKITG